MSRPFPVPPVGAGDVLASKYRVERVLGKGGMGVVVAATHLDLEQSVALKFLLPASASDPVVVERFLREARASVRLKSPHVARTLDTGRLEDGCPFIVMELLDGRDLAAEVDARRSPMPVADAASYVLQACDALAEAHAVGIVHRDLKPANLFLARGHDGHPQVKVLDFGISKLTQAAGASSPPASVTATESVFGSPSYMSPEQMRSSKGVDARTDIWSIGVVLYELATGQLPFVAPTAIEVGLKISQDEPTRPRAHRRDLPERFERVILRCLEKDRSRRFASVAELAQALAPFAHPRDRSIADRVHDIARAGARRASDDAGHLAATEPSLGGNDLAVDDTQLAHEKMPFALDHTNRAVTNQTDGESRPVGRWLASAGVLVIAVGAIVTLQRVWRAPAPAEDATTSSPSGSASSSEATAPAAALPMDAVALPIGAETSASRSGAAAASIGAAPAASASSVIAAHSPKDPHSGSKSRRPAPAISAPTHSAAGTETPDAGRFFRVRE